MLTSIKSFYVQAGSGSQGSIPSLVTFNRASQKQILMAVMSATNGDRVRKEPFVGNPNYEIWVNKALAGACNADFSVELSEDGITLNIETVFSAIFITHEYQRRGLGAELVIAAAQNVISYVFANLHDFESRHLEAITFTRDLPMSSVVGQVLHAKFNDIVEEGLTRLAASLDVSFRNEEIKCEGPFLRIVSSRD